jgi:hypothetical protein
MHRGAESRDNNSLFSKGCEWFFSSCFPAGSGRNVFFEADPNYLYFGRCIDRIFSCDPTARIIVILRNPIDRAFSHYLMMKKWGMDKLSFEDACLVEKSRISKGEWEKADFGYLDRSRYASQVEHVLSVFPQEQVLFVVFENFIQDQVFEFTRIQKWLGLNPTAKAIVEKKNIASSTRSEFLAALLHSHQYRPLRAVLGKLTGTGLVRQRIKEVLSSFNQVKFGEGNKPKVSKEFRTTLLGQFEADIRDVESLTGLDLSGWLE